MLPLRRPRNDGGPLNLDSIKIAIETLLNNCFRVLLNVKGNFGSKFHETKCLFFLHVLGLESNSESSKYIT